MKTDQMMMTRTRRPSRSLTTKTTSTMGTMETTQMAVSMIALSIPQETGPRMVTLALVLHTSDDVSTNEASEVPRSTQTQAQSSLLCRTKQ